MRLRRHGCLATLAIAAGLSGCEGAEPSFGLTNLLRVDGAQWMSGRISDTRGAAPVQVTATTSARSQVYAGQEDVPVTGLVGPDDETGPLASAVAIGMDQEDSYWILPAPERDSTNSFLMRFRASLSFAPALDPSSFPVDETTGAPVLTVNLRAVTQGQMGEIRPFNFGLLAVGPPDGDLVIALAWNAPVDLDLHVVAPLPDGSDSIEVWAKNPSALPPEGQAGAPDGEAAREAGGYLDMDSNAGCQIDNRNVENVVWTGPAPPGHYIVRVDAFSLCGAKSASWHATASLRGRLIQSTWGTAKASHASLPHRLGSGMTAFEFDVQ